MSFQLTFNLQLTGTITVTCVPVWILAAGHWNDLGAWDDAAVWSD